MITCSSKKQFLLVMILIILSFSTPIQILTFDDIHLLCTLLFMGLLLLLCFKRILHSCIDPLTVFSGLVILYMLGSWLYYSYAYSVNTAFLIALLGAATYLIPIMFWELAAVYVRPFNLVYFYRAIIAIGLIMAIFGLYQVLVDPTLFGIMDKASNLNTVEAMKNVSVYRATSFHTSSQTYAFCLSISIALLIEKWNEIGFSSQKKGLVLAVIALAGISTGSKLFVGAVVVVLLFLILKRVKERRGEIESKGLVAGFSVLFLTGLGILIFTAVASDEIKNDMASIVGRSLDFFQWDNQSNITRQEKMGALFEEGSIINILIGNGLSSSSYSASSLLGANGRFTTESYIISIWYEMGVTGVLLFFSIVIGALQRAIHGGLFPITIIVILFATAVSPAFYSYSLLPFWGFLVLPFADQFATKNCTKEKVPGAM